MGLFFMCIYCIKKRFITGGFESASKNYIGLYGLQTAQLRHHEKQEKQSGSSGNEKILQIL